MLVFQGHTDPDPVLYAATWAVSRSPGALLLRSTDGKEFTPVSPYGVIDTLVESDEVGIEREPLDQEE